MRWTLALLACSCATAAPSPSSPRAKPAVVQEEPSSEPFRVLSPVERVPEFRVTDSSGRHFDSRTLIGQRAFAVVFFATWCNVCEMKLPEVQRVAAPFGDDVTLIYVSVDEPQSWSDVPAYLARQGVRTGVVRAESFPRFAVAYDPLQTVPVVAVVGKNGYLVDYQVGWGRSHERRLHAALQVARRIPRDAPAFLKGKAGDADTTD